MNARRPRPDRLLASLIALVARANDGRGDPRPHRFYHQGS
jgi:hypothetical protein